MATKQRTALVSVGLSGLCRIALYLALTCGVVPAKAQPDDRSTRIQLQEIFRKELGADDRTSIAKYLRHVGLGHGYEWCAAYVSWCFGQLGRSEPCTPWSPSLFPARKVVWQNDGRPQRPALLPGMVWGIHIIAKGRIGHVGFVDSEADGLVITIEGNTGAADGKGPSGVYRKRRGWRTLKAAAEWL